MPFKDIEKRREANRKHYAQHSDEVRKKVQSAKRSKVKEWKAFKATLKCSKCDENHPAALDFHHVVSDPTNIPISTLIKNHAHLKLKEELKKCVVLCANCHRKHHHDAHVEKKRRRKSLKKIHIRTNIAPETPHPGKRGD
jgi:hypothetical protein